MKHEMKLLTAGVIAERLGVPLRRVLYVLQTRPEIRPAARAGILRLYHNAAVDMVAEALKDIDARMGRGECANG